MPLFETEKTARGRSRVFVRTQFPFFLGCMLVTAVVAITEPALLQHPSFLAAWTLIALATVAAIVLPWERVAAPWMITLAVADLIAVSFIDSNLLGGVSAAAVLGMIPVLWLAYGFGTPGIAVAIAGTAYIAWAPYLSTATLPTTTQEWSNALLLPVLILLVVAPVHIAARQLRTSRARSDDASARTRAALQQAVDRSILVRGILDTVNAAVLYYDARGRLIVTSRVADDMSRQIRAELSDVLANGSVDAATAVYAADRTTPVPPHGRVVPRALAGERITEEVQWLGPADAQIAIMASSRQMRRQDGGLIGTVVIAHDVTQLAHALEVSEDFLKTVSHELRTPMTSISGYTDLLEEAIDPAQEPTLRAHLAAVQRNTRRLSDRIGELLSATESAAPLHVREVDVRALVARVAAGARDDAERRGITVEHLTAAPAVAIVDGERVGQAVRELIANAVKFAASHTAVTVGQDVEGDSVRIWVSDAGPGIGRADQARIFDRFYRTRDARTNAVQGFGLGLTQVRTIVAAHGGTVSVDSAPGAGSRFTIVLPGAVALGSGSSHRRALVAGAIR